LLKGLTAKVGKNLSLLKLLVARVLVIQEEQRKIAQAKEPGQ
jgi:hypothetical protein